MSCPPRASTLLFVEFPEDLPKRGALEKPRKQKGFYRSYRRSSFVLPMTER